MKKFFAVSLLISINLLAMDNDQIDIKDPKSTEKRVSWEDQESLLSSAGNIEKRQQEKLSNTEQIFLDEIKQKCAVLKARIIGRLDSLKQKVDDSEYAKIFTEKLHKIIAVAQNHKIPASLVLSVYGYMFGGYIPPVKLVDGVWSECVTLNIPLHVSAGLCVPGLASFIYNHINILNGALFGLGSYVALKKYKKQKSD